MIILGNIGRMIGLLIFAALTTPLFGALGAMVFAVSLGIMMPSLQSLATRTVDEKNRGGVLGLYQSAISLSTIVSTAIAGIIFAISATLPYWIGGFLGILALVPAVILMRRYGGKRAPSKEAVTPAD